MYWYVDAQNKRSYNDAAFKKRTLITNYEHEIVTPSSHP